MSQLEKNLNSILEIYYHRTPSSSKNPFETQFIVTENYFAILFLISIGRDYNLLINQLKLPEKVWIYREEIDTSIIKAIKNLKELPEILESKFRNSNYQTNEITNFVLVTLWNIQQTNRLNRGEISAKLKRGVCKAYVDVVRVAFGVDLIEGDWDLRENPRDEDQEITYAIINKLFIKMMSKCD